MRTLGKRGEIRVAVELLERRLDELVGRLCFVDGLTVPSAHLPAGHVGHQARLLVAIARHLLEELAIAFGHQQRQDGQTPGAHLNAIALDLAMRQIVDVHAGGRDAEVAGNALVAWWNV